MDMKKLGVVVLLLIGAVPARAGEAGKGVCLNTTTSLKKFKMSGDCYAHQVEILSATQNGKALPAGQKIWVKHCANRAHLYLGIQNQCAPLTCDDLKAKTTSFGKDEILDGLPYDLAQDAAKATGCKQRDCGAYARQLQEDYCRMLEYRDDIVPEAVEYFGGTDLEEATEHAGWLQDFENDLLRLEDEYRKLDCTNGDISCEDPSPPVPTPTPDKWAQCADLHTYIGCMEDPDRWVTNQLTCTMEECECINRTSPGTCHHWMEHGFKNRQIHRHLNTGDQIRSMDPGGGQNVPMP